MVRHSLVPGRRNVSSVSQHFGELSGLELRDGAGRFLSKTYKTHNSLHPCVIWRYGRVYRRWRGGQEAEFA